MQLIKLSYKHKVLKPRAMQKGDHLLFRRRMFDCIEFCFKYDASESVYCFEFSLFSL